MTALTTTDVARLTARVPRRLGLGQRDPAFWLDPAFHPERPPLDLYAEVIGLCLAYGSDRLRAKIEDWDDPFGRGDERR